MSPERRPATGETGAAVPMSRDARTRRRREEIVAAAARTFAEQGYASVGMREIADAVGVRGASLYHHFPSKEDILHAVCLTVTREPNEENLPLLDAAGTPAQRLVALVGGHLRHLHRRRTEHLVGLHEMAALTPAHRAEIDGYRRHYQRRVRDVIAAGIRSGEFTVPDARLATFAVLDMLNGLSNWFRPDRDLDLDTVVSGYVDLVVVRMLGASRCPSPSPE
ncbi:TetR/AcrR family transcriptional regulator, partial [Pseudonocardia sp. KRD291]|uniref:TetR/AcrR family transcriptional regulator n=1 Tax=Pseudonocardia sp. KRD291 TaxID=2792007 RepID=UPI0027E2D25C